ncbi:hypothetical protein BJ170DRAFT_417852 [Xylariales sp. AK1849]|nr:hypothetical protein BJ170DRAFT_417852 [Xylariales sp. AK1849]
MSILSAVCFRRPLSDLKTDILDVCRDLQVHIRELAPIMEGYSKHWNSEKATVNLPIDPGFYEWLSGLKVELLGVQAVILESQMTQASSSSSLSASSGELAAYRTKLKEFHNQIVDFIPIMRSDYDEYHTQNMPLVTDPEPLTPSRQRHSRRNIQADMGLNKGHDHLRRELYALKDQMSACVVSLRRFHPYQPSYRLATFQTLMHSYETIESTLSLMLSNHASDWINYSLEGNITYPEFCRLNPDTIRSLSLQLKEVSESLNATVGLMDSLRYSNDPDDILGDSKQLELRKSDYDTLKVIKEVLTSLFQIRQL